MDRKVLEFNGSFFEQEIVKSLYEQFSDECIVIHNKELYSDFLGKNTQIDVILLHKHGAYVIEAKNWKHWIKGNYADFYWAGKSAQKDVMRVISPINQNFLHVRALKNAIRKKGIQPLAFSSVICVPDGTDILSDCSELCNFSLLPYYVEKNFDNNICLDLKAWGDIIMQL